MRVVHIVEYPHNEEMTPRSRKILNGASWLAVGLVGIAFLAYCLVEGEIPNLSAQHHEVYYRHATPGAYYFYFLFYLMFTLPWLYWGLKEIRKARAQSYHEDE